MRIDADVRKSVVFLGHAEHDMPDSFVAAGTGFFVAWHGTRFLVTAQHVAIGLGEGPYCVRLNKFDGDSDHVMCDPEDEPLLRWISHPDPNVDLVVSPWGYDFQKDGYDALAINGDLIRPEKGHELQDVGVGDLCYAIGLFRLLQGKQRNVPVVHTGHIAMMAGDELIPMEDWLEPRKGKRRHVNGYLVQMQNLRGLSGAPVFVRTGLDVVAQGFKRDGQKITKEPLRAVTSYNADVGLIGVWSGSWDAPHDQVAAVEYGHGNRVPIGLGTVVPAHLLIELLEQPAVISLKAKWNARVVAQKAERDTPATPDVAD